MAKNIYVGNLAWSVTSDDLLELFGQYGKVLSAQVISDRDTGRSRGFGFVEMEDEEDDEDAPQRLAPPAEVVAAEDVAKNAHPPRQ